MPDYLTKDAELKAVRSKVQYLEWKVRLLEWQIYALGAKPLHESMSVNPRCYEPKSTILELALEIAEREMHNACSG